MRIPFGILSSNKVSSNQFHLIWLISKGSNQQYCIHFIQTISNETKFVLHRLWLLAMFSNIDRYIFALVHDFTHLLVVILLLATGLQPTNYPDAPEFGLDEIFKPNTRLYIHLYSDFIMCRNVDEPQTQKQRYANDTLEPNCVQIAKNAGFSQICILYIRCIIVCVCVIVF